MKRPAAVFKRPAARIVYCHLLIIVLYQTQFLIRKQEAIERLPKRRKEQNSVLAKAEFSLTRNFPSGSPSPQGTEGTAGACIVSLPLNRFAG